MEFPSDEELLSLKALILPGSYHSVYEEGLQHQVEPYKKFIKKIFYEHPHIKLVGICFGHQIIAEALGGRVARMNSSIGLYSGKETIKVENDFFEMPCVKQVLSEYDTSDI